MSTITEQELKELILNLGHPLVDEFLKNTFERAEEEKNKILPLLYEQYKAVLSSHSSAIACQRTDLLVALLLLGKWEETSAAETVCQFVTLAAPQFCKHLDGLLIGSLDVILANICCKRVDLLQGLLKNSSIRENIRNPVIDSLLILFARDLISREDLLTVFKELLLLRGEEAGDYLDWELLIQATIAIYPDEEALLLIKKAIDEGLTIDGVEEEDLAWIDYKNFQDVEEALSQFSSMEECLEAIRDFYRRELGDCFEELNCNYVDDEEAFEGECDEEIYIDDEEDEDGDDEPLDLIDSEERETFEKELRASGGDLYPERNEDCFCGSQKKYKKCCEAQDLARKANVAHLKDYKKVEFVVMDDPLIEETIASWGANVGALIEEEKFQELAQFFKNCQMLTDLYPETQTFDVIMACAFHNIWLLYAIWNDDFLAAEMHYAILEELIEDFSLDAPLDMHGLKAQIDGLRISRRIQVFEMRNSGQ